MPSQKILIIEDNQDLRTMYKIAFEESGYEVSLCQNGMNAVSLVDTFQPDIILLDIMMPFVSGFDFLKTVRARENHVKIIINSNLSQESDIQKGKELGADEYFKKTDFTPFELVKKIGEILY